MVTVKVLLTNVLKHIRLLKIRTYIKNLFISKRIIQTAEKKQVTIVLMT